MPRKVRELISDLERAGFVRLPGAGKGSHRKFVHDEYPGAVTVSGRSGGDARPYQEQAVRRAVKAVSDEES